MSELIEKIKSAEPKTILIYSILILGVVIALFSFGGNDDKDVNVNTVDIKDNDKSVFSTKKEALLAKYGKDQNDNVPYIDKDFENIEDVTDDPDAIRIIQEARREDQDNYKEQPRNYNQTPQANPSVEKLENAIKPKEVVPEEPKEVVTEEPKEVIPEEPKGNRFFEGKRKERRGNTFSCVVHGEQEVMNGSTLKLRLKEDYTTSDGVKIDRGTTIWGVCSLTKDRMNVTVQSVLKGKDLIPLNFVVYDIDGLQGINLPNNVKAEIAKRAKADAIRNTQTDDIIGNSGMLERGANAVINTTKNILSRKQEEIKITVKSNYQLVLKPVMK